MPDEPLLIWLFMYAAPLARFGARVHSPTKKFSVNVSQMFHGCFTRVHNRLLSISRCIYREINIDDLIAHSMALDKINDAFELTHEGKSIRSVVVY